MCMFSRQINLAEILLLQAIEDREKTVASEILYL